MSLTSEIQEALNQQINLEFAAGYTYLAMASYFEDRSLNGFGHWMRLQYQEENGHAMKFYNFVQDRGGRVVLDTISKPIQDFASPLDAFEKSLEHEQKVTACINGIYALALEKKDYATVAFLKWFVDEQVEEEKNATDMIDRLKLAGDNPNALLILDSQAGARTAEGE